MRFMILVKADKNTEAGMPPSEQLIAEMGKYNEELAKAGVLLAAEGLQPSSKGARDVGRSLDRRLALIEQSLKLRPAEIQERRQMIGGSHRGGPREGRRFPGGGRSRAKSEITRQ